jgi:protein-disulfide isomerase
MDEKKFGNLIVPAAIIFAGLIIAGALVYSGKNAPTPSDTGNNPPVEGNNNAVKVAALTTDGLPYLGSPAAKVTMVEFSDFQCPYCKMFQDNVVKGFLQKYLQDGSVKFIYKDFAFLGQESKDASLAAQCANEQGKYWEMHDTLFKQQNGENQGTFSKTKLQGFAKDINLDMLKYNSCFDSRKYDSAVAQSYQEGMTGGVQGTPAVFLNGVLLNPQELKIQSYADYEAVIKKAVDAAK